MATAEHASEPNAGVEKPAVKSIHGEGSGVCKGCVNWAIHGKNCWVFWEGKRVCSQHVDETGDWRGGFKNVSEFDEFLL